MQIFVDILGTYNLNYPCAISFIPVYSKKKTQNA